MISDEFLLWFCENKQKKKKEYFVELLQAKNKFRQLPHTHTRACVYVHYTSRVDLFYCLKRVYCCNVITRRDRDCVWWTILTSSFIIFQYININIIYTLCTIDPILSITLLYNIEKCYYIGTCVMFTSAFKTSSSYGIVVCTDVNLTYTYIIII